MAAFTIAGFTLGEILFGASLATSAVGIAQSARAGRESRKAQQAQQRIADVKASRERIKAVREARIRRAQVLQGAEATGTAGSSAALGAVGSIQSQTASNIGFLNQVQGLSQQASIFGQRAATARSRAGTFGTLSTIFSEPSTASRIEGLFN